MRTSARVILVAVVATIVLVRVPFLRGQLCDEEGQVATAVRHMIHGERPRYTLARDAQEHEVLILPEHNLGGYLVPALLFAAPYYALHADRSLDRRVASVPWLRSVYLLIYATALVLALLMLPPERRLLGALLAGGFALFPLPLLASVQIQYDGAVSTLLLVASAFLLQRGCAREQLGLMAAGGFVLALGKLEYLCAGVGMAIAAAIVYRNARVVLAWGGGALVGLGLCAAIDWTNFVAGYRVIGKFAGYQQATGMTKLQRIRVFLQLFTGELWPLFVGLALALLSAVSVWRERRQVVFTLAPAAAVVGAYVLFAWRGDGFPRYFAPAFVLLPIALAQLWRPAWWSFAVAALFVIAGASAARPELAFGPKAFARHVGVAGDTVALSRAFEASKTDCMHLTSWETMYYTVHAHVVCWAYTAYEPSLVRHACR